MSIRFRYVAGGKVLVDPIEARQTDPNAYYSLGEKFDNYDFKRNNPVSGQSVEFLERRIRQLREKYSYIRLWFSGGKDSTLALATAIKHNIHIDEIVIYRRFCKNGAGWLSEFHQSREIEGSAIKYLTENKSNLTNTKVSFIDVDDKEFSAPFRDPLWYTYTNEYFFSITYTPNMFYRYLNPAFKILSEPENRVDLCGGGAPAVWQNQTTKNWYFCFSDTNFVTVHSSPNGSSQYEDFLTSDDMPELTEYYVNTVIDSYIKDGTTSESWSKNDSPQIQRSVRDRSALYESLKNFNGFQFPKTPIKIDFKEYFWQVDPGSKKTWYDLVNRYHQKPIPVCLQLYIENTDWDAIKAHRDAGWMTTKIWSIDTNDKYLARNI
jgi:hypothetical protein